MAAPQPFEQAPAVETNASADLTLVHNSEQLHDYELEVVDWKDLGTIIRPTAGVARISTYLAFMSDESRNVVRTVESADKKFDTPFGFATPLGTRVNGFNTYTAIQAAKAGMDSIIIGAPQIWHDDILLQSHEAQVFAKLVQFNYGTTRNDVAQIVLGGYSWAAMRAPAEAHYLDRLGIAVPLIKTKDPCLAERTSLSETKTDMTVPYVASELIEGGKAVFSKEHADSWLHGMRRLGHLATTLSPSPRYLATHARVTRELWKGEAGDFVRYTPDNSALIAHFMVDSPFNDYEQYRNAIELLPHGRAVLEEGVHFTPSRRDILKSYIGQIAYGQFLIERGATAAELADELDIPLGFAA